MVRKILMVCLGNFSRSPIAEAVMKESISKAGLSKVWEVDSAAITSEHRGRLPDSRALSVLKKHNLSYSKHARQIRKQDFEDFDYIFGMDESNVQDLKRMAPNNSKARLLLLGTFGLEKSERIIVDPCYQRGEEGFEKAYQQSVVACDAFLKQI